MGCCLTTTATSAAEVDFKIHSKTRDTSPPGSVEETVKEVLSETPNTHLFKSQQQFRSKNVVVPMSKTTIQQTASEVSSEMYSCSASLSAATTTTIGTGTEIDGDGEVTQKVNKPPLVKLVPRRPPARRSVVRSTDRNLQLTSRTVTNGQRSRNVATSSVVGGERVRRMRSPAVRGEAVERRKVKKSGERVSVNVKLRRVSDVGVLQVPVPVPELEREMNESLENPLVSLECFIFL